MTRRQVYNMTCTNHYKYFSILHIKKIRKTYFAYCNSITHYIGL